MTLPLLALLLFYLAFAGALVLAGIITIVQFRRVGILQTPERVVMIVFGVYLAVVLVLALTYILPFDWSQHATIPLPFSISK